MNADPVSRVVGILGREGYEARERLVVASIAFDFGAVLVAPGRFDLIIVVDTAIEDSQKIPDRVAALSRALDVSRSQRPLTTVLVGPRPKPSVIEATAKMSRVLLTGPINPDISDEDIRVYLAVLLPIKLPDSANQLADSMLELAGEIDELATEPLTARLIGASKVGKNAVEKELLRALAEPLAEQPG